MSKPSEKNRFPEKRFLRLGNQINHREQEYLISFVYLILKVTLSLLAMVSLIKLSYSSKVRLTRLREINESYSYEKSRFQVLSNRFDDLLSVEGQQRFMKDQDQMIYRDIIRVIWR